MSIMLKCCNSTHEGEAFLPISEFQPSVRTARSPTCIACVRRRYQRNRMKVVAQVQQYAKANPDVNKDASKRYRDANKEKRKATLKKYRDSHKDNICFLANKRRAQKLKATPTWFTREEPLIRALYAEAERLTKSTGILHVVDHIVPLQSDIVCGLHCLANLRVITQTENIAKSNKLLDIGHS